MYVYSVDMLCIGEFGATSIAEVTVLKPEIARSQGFRFTSTSVLISREDPNSVTITSVRPEAEATRYSVATPQH
jgi:hypothetical protein